MRAGPTTAFEIVGRFRPGSYRLALLAPGGGGAESSSGLKLSSEPLRGGPFDTIVVAGGDVARSRAAMQEIAAWLRNTRARRTASVCSGAYFLAMAGRLDGRRATAHWASLDDFGRRCPEVKLDADRIFIRDGDIWPSAGISAGSTLRWLSSRTTMAPSLPAGRRSSWWSTSADRAASCSSRLSLTSAGKQPALLL